MVKCTSKIGCPLAGGECDKDGECYLWRCHNPHATTPSAAPKPQPCHACETKYAGAVCPTCKEERPAYTALKAMSARLPLTDCHYYHGQQCNCGGRGVCLPAA